MAASLELGKREVGNLNPSVLWLRFVPACAHRSLVCQSEVADPWFFEADLCIKVRSCAEYFARYFRQRSRELARGAIRVDRDKRQCHGHVVMRLTHSANARWPRPDPEHPARAEWQSVADRAWRDRSRWLPGQHHRGS